MAKTVLAVDSDPQVLKRIGLVLGDKYRVWAYRDPRTALAVVTEGVRPQLVLCSLRLPGMAGLDFLRELRSTAKLGRVPVVFMVGYREQRLFDRVLPGDRDSRLVKPFGELELQALVERYLDYPTRP